MEKSVVAVEQILSYNFKNKKLLEEALTHSSYANSASYERLEFVGDSAIGLAITNYFFLAYPDLHQGQLSSLRAANISTEKLARVAVRHGLYHYLRRNAPALDNKVREFVDLVALEGNSVQYGGLLVKAPKVLADIVESVAGAIYVDVDFDLQRLWVIIRGFLEPIYTPEALKVKLQPVTVLFELCNKNGKQVDIKNGRNGSKNVASVYVDGSFVASGSSMQKEIAKLNAAKEALIKLSTSVDTNMRNVVSIDDGIHEAFEIEGAKQKLQDICCKKKWAKPNYSIEKDLGAPHERRIVSSVEIVTSFGIMYILGDAKSRVRDAENSAAFLMISALQERIEQIV